MPELLDNMYPHQAVYWAPSGTINDNGQVTFASPVQLCVRWTEESEMFLDRNGNQQVSRAKLRLPRGVEELGVMWLGCLSDLTSTVDPFANVQAWEIRKFKRVANRNSTKYLRIALL